MVHRIPCISAVSFRGRAMNERALLPKMTYKDKASYASSLVYYNEWNAAPPREFGKKFREVPKISEGF